jgi:hypothetical protein
VTPQQLERAQVIPHPGINPTVQAAMPGKTVTAPPVRAQSFATTNRVAASSARPARTENRPTNSLLSTPPHTSPPALITRAAPPPQRVPFTDQQRPMSEHPGRPLEPLQLENLRAGRAAGPMLDREFPPHVAVPRARPAAPRRRGRP